MRYAIVRNGVVDNIVEWDGQSPWQTPEGCTAIVEPTGVGIGWTLVKDVWTAPKPPPTDVEGG